ncbi:hypothetical protein DSECCO2_140150 [anaerobic digester metagenome]
MRALGILLLFSIFYLNVFSQEAIVYSEVVEVSDTDKDELFIRAREWFNETFNSSRDVLQISDKETGELSGKGLMKVNYTFNYMGKRNFSCDVRFQVSLWVRDGRYKYEFTNFFIEGNDDSIEFGLVTTSNETNIIFKGYSEKKLNEIYLSIKESIDARTKILIEDLNIKMKTKSKAVDW